MHLSYFWSTLGSIRFSVFVIFLLCWLAAAPATASDPSLVFLQLAPDASEGLAVDGFSVLSDVDVYIDANGAGVDGKMYAYPWILNASTREVVWEMTFKDSEKAGSKDRYFQGALRLEPGSYLVYFASMKMRQMPIKIGPIEEWLKGAKDTPTDWGITLSTATAEERQELISEYAVAEDDGPVIALHHLGDDAFIRTPFRMLRDSTVRIYAIGEGLVFADIMADYSWIVQSATRKRVWEMTTKNTTHAGGASKNRVFDGEIFLSKGDYELFTISDDTHSAQAWNSLPPHDPERWGISLYAEEGDISLLDSSDEVALVRLTAMGDNQSAKAMFDLNAPADVHIYAFGEWLPGSREMADYAWIVKADSNVRVWKMEPADTVHGGGNVKNRLYDGLLHLEPGRYVVHYRTDDTHSYAKWNASPPFDRASYGITVSLPANRTGWQQISTAVTPAEGKDVLVRIVRVGNSALRKERFSLSEPSKVRIYALGEGVRGLMADYAWIETIDGSKVWKMTMDKTTDAGGTSKNRLYDGLLRLPQGDYVAYYKTDDSHAYGSWNARKPDNPEAWGITIYLVSPDH